jgi:hypothetical protein
VKEDTETQEVRKELMELKKWRRVKVSVEEGVE